MAAMADSSEVCVAVCCIVLRCVAALAALWLLWLILLRCVLQCVAMCCSPSSSMAAIADSS